MKKFVLAIIVAFSLFMPVRAEKGSFPTLSSQVVDEAGVLTAAQKNQLTQILQTDKINQIAVAIVKDLQGMDGRQFGIELARKWQLGQKDKNNGVLILLATKDRYVGIEVGYGLEEILPDSVTGRIIREKMIPPLTENLNYYQSLVNGATAIMGIITNDENQDKSTSMEDILFIILIIFMILFGKSGGKGSSVNGGGYGGGFGGKRRFFTGGGGSFGGGGAGRRF